MSYKINYSAEEKIKLAKDDSVEKLYESKKNQRTVRVLTVLAYVLTVSMAAIILSTYYVFCWHPKYLKNNSTFTIQHTRVNCDVLVIPENIAIRLINDTEVSVDVFYNEIKRHLEQLHSDALKINPKMTRLEFNQYLQDISTTTVSMDRKMARKKMKMNKKKIIDDEDLNMDMESSGDKDQQIVTTFPTPTSESDLNDTTIIFDQEP